MCRSPSARTTVRSRRLSGTDLALLQIDAGHPGLARPLERLEHDDEPGCREAIGADFTIAERTPFNDTREPRDFLLEVLDGIGRAVADAQLVRLAQCQCRH